MHKDKSEAEKVHQEEEEARDDEDLDHAQRGMAEAATVEEEDANSKNDEQPLDSGDKKETIAPSSPEEEKEENVEDEGGGGRRSRRRRRDEEEKLPEALNGLSPSIYDFSIDSLINLQGLKSRYRVFTHHDQIFSLAALSLRLFLRCCRKYRWRRSVDRLSHHPRSSIMEP